jgi:hypothetical protein
MMSAVALVCSAVFDVCLKRVVVDEEVISEEVTSEVLAKMRARRSARE